MFQVIDTRIPLAHAKSYRRNRIPQLQQQRQGRRAAFRRAARDYIALG